MDAIPLWHLAVVCGVFLVALWGLFAAYDDLRQRVEAIEGKAAYKFLHTPIAPLNDELDARLKRLERVECQRRGIIALTPDAGKIDYATWITKARDNGWIKDKCEEE